MLNADLAEVRDAHVSETALGELASVAWRARENSYIVGKTRVGSAVLSGDGRIFSGCNVEHMFRSHDVHAEVNAITTMVAAGNTVLRAIVIVAERERFTPCGACMDWIFQFGGPSCVVAIQPGTDAPLQVFRAHDLMPYYPY